MDIQIKVQGKLHGNEMSLVAKKTSSETTKNEILQDKSWQDSNEKRVPDLYTPQLELDVQVNLLRVFRMSMLVTRLSRLRVPNTFMFLIFLESSPT